jgi:AraC-like DNA-binding protein
LTALLRARLSASEHELGSWERARRPPDPRLQGVVGRELVGYQHSSVRFEAWLEPARPELTLMIDLDGEITADGAQLPDAWVGGLSDACTVVGVCERYGSIDLKLDPLGAYRLLGFPLSEVTGACVSLDDVFGADGPRLADRLRELEDWDARFDVLERFLLARLAAGPVADPAVAWAWWRLQQTAGRVRIETLATELGASRRYLARRFAEQVGLSPKTVARLLRFAGVRRRIERDPSDWAQIAFEAGYADQSHLNREFQQLAGTTPTDFAARQIPGGGVLGDGCGPSAEAPRRAVPIYPRQS